MSGCVASEMVKNEEDVVTGRFRMPAAKFASRLAIYYALRPIALICVAVLACMIIGFLMNPPDLRWIAGGLMLLFVAAPMLLAFLYISKGFNPGCFFNTLNHTVVFSDSDVSVNIFPRYDEEEEEEPEAVEIKYAYRSVMKIDVGGEAVTLRLGDNREGFLWIPYTAFSDPEALQMAMSKLRAGMAQSSEN